MPGPKKFIKIDGVMRPNPDHPANKAKAAAASSTILKVDIALTVITSVDDIMEHNAENPDAEIKMAASTESAVEILQDEMILDQFHPDVNDSAILLDGLAVMFAKWDCPIGMVGKLVEISTEEMRLDFLVDDSGSMCTHDAKLADGRACTRWDEAKERLMDMLSIMSYIPVPRIRIQFLNRADVVILSHEGKTPTNFLAQAKSAIDGAFMQGPNHSTPILEKLTPIIQEAEAFEGRTCVYLLFDGQPNGGEAAKAKIGDMLMHRSFEKIPFTFITCTDQDSEVEWAKQLEEKVSSDGEASWMSEMDDFEAERNEVAHDQGYGVPYSRGFWLLCNLASAINPNDLDCLDEEIPLTQYTLQNLLGRDMTPQEYSWYWKNYMENPLRAATDTEPETQTKVQNLWGPHYGEFGAQSLAYPPKEAASLPVVQAYKVNVLKA